MTHKYTLEFTETGISKHPQKKAKKWGNIFTISYIREHGKDTIEWVFTTKKRFQRNPFEWVQKAVFEILWVIPWKWTMAHITLNTHFWEQQIFWTTKEEIKKNGLNPSLIFTIMVGDIGVEPTTSCMSCKHSNHWVNRP